MHSQRRRTYHLPRRLLSRRLNDPVIYRRSSAAKIEHENEPPTYIFGVEDGRPHLFHPPPSGRRWNRMSPSAPYCVVNGAIIRQRLVIYFPISPKTSFVVAHISNTDECFNLERSYVRNPLSIQLIFRSKGPTSSKYQTIGY